MVERPKKKTTIHTKTVSHMKEGKRCEKKKKSRKVLKEAEILFVHRNNLQILINALLSVLRKEELVTFQNLELFICFVRK